MSSAEPTDNIVEMRGAKSKAARDAEQTAEADAWAAENLLTRSELGKLPALEWRIRDVYVEGTLANVFGDSGDGKSFVVLDQALCIATGRPWHGKATRPGTVLYLCGEGKHGINERVSAWEAEYNEGEQVPDSSFLMFADVTPLTRATDEKARLHALTRMLGRVRPNVIVVDTLARYAEGVEENSATEMGRVVSVVDQFAKRLGATVILVHHTARGTSHARGSVALKGALETELYVERKKGMCGTITVTKQKNAPDGEEFPYELVPVKGSLAVRIGAETSGTVDPFMRPAGLITAKSSYPKRVAWVLWETWHDTGGATKAEVKKALKENPDLTLPAKRFDGAFYDAWSALERDGYLEPGLTGGKHLLSAKGIHELRFTSELLEYVRKQRGHRGPGGGDEYSD